MGTFGRSFGRSRGRAFVQANPNVVRPGIVISASSVAANASIGTLVGTLSVSNGSGAYVFAVTTNDYFELDGVDDTRVEVKAALDVGVHDITFQADNGVDPVVETTIPIRVTEA